MLNHVQTRFVFDPRHPVELYPLEREIVGDPCHLVEDLVYSIEAVGPLGVRFNFRDGFVGNLIVRTA